MFRIEMAGLVIGIDNQWEYVSRLCERYKIDTEKEDFRVSVTEEEILEEQSQGTGQFSYPYCEAICLYRRICLRLIDYDGFLMHSAAVALDGKAYIFAAKSGVGKTTHMRLWMKEFGDRLQVINGDKPVFRFREGKLYACGTPWCGKEGLGNPIMAPVKAVCFLEQSPDNSIRRLETGEVVGRIFHQMLMPKGETAANRFLDLVDKMLASVDYYLLRCNREQEAARLAYEGMNGIEGCRQAGKVPNHVG